MENEPLKQPVIIQRISDINAAVEKLYSILAPVLCESRISPVSTDSKQESLVMEKLNSLLRNVNSIISVIDIQE